MEAFKQIIKTQLMHLNLWKHVLMGLAVLFNIGLAAASIVAHHLCFKTETDGTVVLDCEKAYVNATILFTVLSVLGFLHQFVVQCYITKIDQKFVLKVIKAFLLCRAWILVALMLIQSFPLWFGCLCGLVAVWDVAYFIVIVNFRYVFAEGAPRSPENPQN